MTNNELNERFRDLRQSETGCADEKMEDRLRIAFRARQRTLRIRSYALEIAASLAVACGLYFLLSNTGTALREKTINATPAREAQFVVLPYGQNDVPLEQPVIVRVQVGEDELSHLGVSVPALPRHSRVEADLLVGQDGIARAVRVNRSF